MAERRAIRVRPARPADRDALTALQWRASLAWESDRQALLAQAGSVDPPLLPIEDGRVLVAVLGEDVAGFAVVLPRDDGDVELDGLFVDPDHWRKGIGARLVRAAEGLAAKSGVAVLHLSANPNAKAFYLACGFVDLGEVPTQFGVGVVMSKALIERVVDTP